VRASRLVSILLLLQTRSRMTAAALASELEVSVRTIYRDVESLQMAGVPLYGDAGPAGGYQLLDGYRTRLTGLSASEAEALFLAGMPEPAAALGLGTVVAAAQLKIRAALPPELRDRAGRIQERFLLDAPGWYTDDDDPPHLVAVADAVWNQRRIQVRYRRWRAPTDVTRTLDPVGVVLKAGRWYVVARSDADIRTFRVDQILDLSTLDETFERPAGFDLTAHWRGYVVEFRDRLWKGEAVIRLSPAGRDQAPDLFGGVVARAIEDAGRAGGAGGTGGAGGAGADDDGWITVTIPIESLPRAESDLLRFGATVEVLSPPELRERIAATAAGLARLYA
jgi:predicted DNA-binding transcriptional regulator YafY